MAKGDVKLVMHMRRKESTLKDLHTHTHTHSPCTPHIPSTHPNTGTQTNTIDNIKFN